MPSQIKTETVKSAVGGVSLEGFRAVDESRTGKRPGVLVFHEWWGLDDHMKRRARMLAELGYTAFAADMYGGGKVAADAAEANQKMSTLLGDLPSAEARLKAALQQLTDDPTVDRNRIGAIGYCLGGAMVLHAARLGLPLAGVVSFHGSLGSFHKPVPGAVKAKILVCHGGGDVLVPEDQVAAFEQEMSAAKADYRVIVYDGALHGFTNRAATENGKKFGLPLAYDAAVDERSWKDMKDFFAKVFA